eukprot:5298466-Lingulodinium_polyedra.AAC.1
MPGYEGAVQVVHDDREFHGRLGHQRLRRRKDDVGGRGPLSIGIHPQRRLRGGGGRREAKR